MINQKSIIFVEMAKKQDDHHLSYLNWLIHYNTENYFNQPIFIN